MNDTTKLSGAKLITLTPNKTYATHDNALKAVQKTSFNEDPKLRYMILKTEENRYFPVFLGEPALQAGAHFHFCVLG